MEEQGCEVCTEMAILDYMIASYVEGMEMSWEEMAAFSSSFLWAENE